ncbi:MAG TPA: hypothetical protein VF938_09385 [Candidatus Angelobacter sp.]
MTVQQNTDHIQTTHIGSLPRPHKLLDILKAKYGRQPYDEAELNSTLAQAVADCVRKQVECGIEIVTDGEYSKPGFFTYIRERFDGFESRPNQKLVLFQKEVSAFPDYYAQYFKEAMMGGAILPIVPVVCTGPVKYKGEEKDAQEVDEQSAPELVTGVIGGRLNAITFALRICCPSAKTRPIKDCAISAALLRSANGLSNGTIKPVFGSFAALRIAGLGARRALKPPEITSLFFNNIGQNEKVSPRFSCLIRNLAPLPLFSVACGLLPKRSPPSSGLGASHSCASAPITSGPLRRRTKGPPRPQAVAQFDLDEEQRKRLAVQEQDRSN